MTSAEFKAEFESLPVKIKDKIHNLTTETTFTDHQREKLESVFGEKWQDYFFGRGVMLK